MQKNAIFYAETLRIVQILTTFCQLAWKQWVFLQWGAYLPVGVINYCTGLRGEKGGKKGGFLEPLTKFPWVNEIRFAYCICEILFYTLLDHLLFRVVF